MEFSFWIAGVTKWTRVGPIHREHFRDPNRRWKFQHGDLAERKLWAQYQEAYQDALSATSTKDAPWFVIPADDKWYARLAIASIIHTQFKKLKLSYPVVTEAQRAELQKAKLKLMSEDDHNGEKKVKIKKDKKTVTKA